MSSARATAVEIGGSAVTRRRDLQGRGGGGVGGGYEFTVSMVYIVILYINFQFLNFA